jgi:carbamoyltransferase
MKILGFSCGHDASACLVVDGEVVADAAEERFTRVKHDSGFPSNAIAWCLRHAGIDAGALDVLAIGGQFLPQAMERYFELSPAQEAALAAMRPVESRARQVLVGSAPKGLPLYMPKLALRADVRLLGIDHHLCHAASAFFTRGRRDRCLVLTMDGIGDDLSGAVWEGEGNTLERKAAFGRDASLAWFYGNVTEALGWQHGDGEGTTMGLAPYGDASKVGDRLDGFHPHFVDGRIATPHAYGQASFVNQHGSYHWHMADAGAIASVIADCGAEHVAARAQQIVEQQVLGIVRHWRRDLSLDRVACAGGLFLNVKLNQRLWEEGGLEELWVYPNPGDAGLALGAALHAWHELAKPERTIALEHLAYGPGFEDEELQRLLDERKLDYRRVDDPAKEAARLLAEDRIVGWFQGRMEAGPRALGKRCILMDASRAQNKDIINQRVKFRQPFRPFCPALPSEDAGKYLADAREAPFMIVSFDARADARERVPAVVHADGTLRPQTVRRETDPLFHRLLVEFGQLSGESLLLSTSLNVRGEPIACHPRDALRCYFDSGLDALVIGRFIQEKPAH